jgi:hypothetical protein
MILFQTPKWFPANLPLSSKNILTAKITRLVLYSTTVLMIVSSAMFITGSAETYSDVVMSFSLILLVVGIFYARNCIATAAKVNDPRVERITTLSHVIFFFSSLVFGIVCVRYLLQSFTS